MKAIDDDACVATKRQRIESSQLFDSKHSFEHRDIVFSPQYPARSFRLMEVRNCQGKYLVDDILFTS